MKTNKFSKVLVGIACMLFLLTACQKNDKPAKIEDATAVKPSGDISILVACFTKDTTFTIPNPGASWTNYALWSTVTANFPLGLKLNWAGFSNSFARPDTLTSSRWFIGTAPLSDSCSSWSTIKSNIAVKNASGNLGTSPSSPYNVVGIDGTFGSDNYGLGYYDYSTGSPTVTKLIVAWIDNTSTVSWPKGISSPSGLASATAYAILVTSLTNTSTPNFSTTIRYRYKAL